MRVRLILLQAIAHLLNITYSGGNFPCQNQVATPNSGFEYVINNLGQGQSVDINFNTLKCCTHDDGTFDADLLNKGKNFNRFFSASVSTLKECGNPFPVTQVKPYPMPNTLPVNSCISTHANADPGKADMNMVALFNPIVSNVIVWPENEYLYTGGGYLAPPSPIYINEIIHINDFLGDTPPVEEYDLKHWVMLVH